MNNVQQSEGLRPGKGNFSLWGGVAAVLALGGLLFFFAPWQSFFQGNPEKTSKKKINSFYVAVPDLLVNLNSPSSRQNFLKLSCLLEVEEASVADDLKEILPRVIDQFQIYLRQLRVGDLKGTEGIFRLKEQLLARANAEAAPLKIKDLLFKNMLVQ